VLLDSYGLCGEQRAHWRERLGNAGGDYAASGVAFPKRFSASVEAKSAAAKLDPLPTRRAQIIIGCPIRDTDDGQHGVVTDRSMESSEGFDPCSALRAQIGLFGEREQLARSRHW
jgi:hypothetical protein